jgi:hypothetical protein
LIHPFEHPKDLTVPSTTYLETTSRPSTTGTLFSFVLKKPIPPNVTTIFIRFEDVIVLADQFNYKTVSCATPAHNSGNSFVSVSYDKENRYINALHL